MVIETAIILGGVYFLSKKLSRETDAKETGYSDIEEWRRREEEEEEERRRMEEEEEEERENDEWREEFNKELAD